MRCLYCGEPLATPVDDAGDAFCSIGHRQMFRWRMSDGKNGVVEKTIWQLVSESQEGKESLAALRRLPVQLATHDAGLKKVETAAEPRKVEVVEPGSRLPDDTGLYDAWLTAWPAEAAVGQRKPRQNPRGSNFAVFPISRWLPSRHVRRVIEMPLCGDAQVARLQRSGKPLRRSARTERALTFPSKPMLGLLRGCLEVTEMDPVKPVVADLMKKVAAAKNLAPGAMDPPSSILFPLGSQEEALPPGKPRQNRMRDVAQWLPKRVDLKGGGQRLLEAQAARTRFAGVEAWRPGTVDLRIEPRAVVDRREKHRLKSYAQLEEAAPGPRAVPAASGAPRHSHWTMPAAGTLEMEMVCPPVQAREAGRLRSLEPVTGPLESGDTVACAVPSSRPALVRPSLGARFLIPGGVTPEIQQPPGLRGHDLTPLETAIVLDTVRPASAAITRLEMTLRAGVDLAPIAVRALPAGPAVAPSEVALIQSEMKPPKPAVPKVERRKRLSPQMARTQARISPGAALAFTGISFTSGELAPLSSEASRLVPKLTVRLTQDQRVSEAVKQYKETAARGWLSWFKPKAKEPSRGKKPGPIVASNSRIPIARGHLKWVVASAPLALIAGFYLIRHSTALIGGVPPRTQQAVEVAAGETADPKAPGEKGIRPPARKGRGVAKRETVKDVKQSPAAQAGETDAQPPADFLGQVKQAILKRAAVSLSDDFRSGLGDWQGYGEWSKQWSYDAATFLNTGPSVVLYTPSLGLTNYRADFLGQIERKSLGWVFRAKNNQNYHAAKITLTHGGPLPRAIVEHYTVINGREDRHQSRPLPLEIRADTLYRVRMDVDDDNFTLSVQGQIVDHWSDNRLPAGGVGFFSARGEQSRLRWIEVTHQYDTLGRLCAFLAPYSLPAKEGNQK